MSAQLCINQQRLAAINFMQAGPALDAASDFAQLGDGAVMQATPAGCLTSEEIP